jgi:cell division cycle 14
MLPSRAAASQRVTSSEQRPMCMTRSTATAAAIQKIGTGSSVPTLPVKYSGQGPNKIPRLTTTRTTSAAKAAAAATRQIQPQPPVHPPRPPPSPIPSRLPTLIPSKRPHHTTSLSVVTFAAMQKRAGTASDAWMTTNVSAVVVPGTKSERPGLRSVRCRQSSFSATDVVA